MTCVINWFSAISRLFFAMRMRARFAFGPRPRNRGCVSDSVRPPLYSDVSPLKVDDSSVTDILT